MVAQSSANMSMSREDGGSGLAPSSGPAPSAASSKLDGTGNSSLAGTHETAAMMHSAGTASISKPNLADSSARHGGNPPRLASEDISAAHLSRPSGEKPGGPDTPQLTEATHRDPAGGATEAIYGNHGPSASGSLLDSASSSRGADGNQPALSPAGHAGVPPGGTYTNLHPKRAAATTAYKRLSVPSLDARTLGIPLPKRTLSDSKSPYIGFKDGCLESIDFSGSDNSGVRSHFSTNPSSPDRSSPYIRHFYAHRSPGLLIALAAKNAERQLREQALSAFPNDDRRRNVVHYVDTERCTPVPSSQASHHDLDLLRPYSEHWEAKENQSLHDKLDTDRGIDKTRQKLHQRGRENSWIMPLQAPIALNKSQGKKAAHVDITRPHSPPMLGKEIVFPRSESPDPARFDVTQGPESLKKTMCYLTEQAERGPGSPRPGGLWTPQKSETELSAHCWSRPVSRVSSCVGLWGGSGADHAPAPLPSGLVTPRFEHDDGSGRLSMSPARGHHRPHHAAVMMLPPSPPHSASGAMERGFEERLRGCAADFDDDEDDDFHHHHHRHGEEHTDDEHESDDAFVTQVYNYLSLGSPAIARGYDVELARIARVPLAELRADDRLAAGSDTGYLRLGPGEPSGEGVDEERCGRWRALRLYIREWERQRPGMAFTASAPGRGAAARKGSWAL